MFGRGDCDFGPVLCRCASRSVDGGSKGRPAMPTTTSGNDSTGSATRWELAPPTASDPGSPAPHASGRPPLRRPTDDRVIAGVCSGLGRALGIDAVIVRLLFVVFTLAGGSGIVLYVLAWIVMPEDGAAPTGDGPASHATGTAAGAVAGLVPVLVGAWMLAERYAPRAVDVVGDAFWPLLLVVAGIALIIRRTP